MLFPKYQGKEIVVPKSLQSELAQTGLTLLEVVYILENGFDCSRSKRRKGIVEKCFRYGNKVAKVVVESKLRWFGGEVWRLRHVGIIGLKRMWFKSS